MDKRQELQEQAPNVIFHYVMGVLNSIITMAGAEQAALQTANSEYIPANDTTATPRVAVEPTPTDIDQAQQREADARNAISQIYPQEDSINDQLAA